MLIKKRIFVATLAAASMVFAANSFAMMGGGGGHGSYSSRSNTYDHHRYSDNSISFGVETRSRWNHQDRMYDVRVRSESRNNISPHHESGVYYDEHMDVYDHRSQRPRRDRGRGSFRSPGSNGYYHHNW